MCWAGHEGLANLRLQTRLGVLYGYKSGPGALSTPPPRAHEKRLTRGALVVHLCTLSDMRVLATNALHACWAHVLVDQMPFLFEYVERLHGAPFDLLFVRSHFDAYPHNKNMLDGGAYRGAYNDLLWTLRPQRVVFEHLTPMRVQDHPLIQHVHMPTEATIWNNASVYPGRPPLPESDGWSKRVQKYLVMRDRVISSMAPQLSIPVSRQHIAIVARRSGSRAFKSSMLSDIRDVGRRLFGRSPKVFYFEFLSLAEQIQVIRGHCAIVMRHGAAEANFLFARPTTMLVEINTHEEVAHRRSIMYDAVCRVANCSHVSVPMNAMLLERLAARLRSHHPCNR